jgi:2-polyprenyl-6-methoxyphenol hydroxylase-like FAD-dependent oxidoreductase
MVTFANGASVEADVVVGADGIHSVLQRHVVEPREPVFSWNPLVGRVLAQVETTFGPLAYGTGVNALQVGGYLAIAVASVPVARSLLVNRQMA